MRQIALAALLACAPVLTLAQQADVLDRGTVQSPVLVIEFERVFAQSAFGQRIVQDVERKGAEIAAQNRQIEAELQEEERQLTEQRTQMEPEAFRALANAFDAKVQKLREEQDTKANDLTTLRDEGQRQFLLLMRPVLENLMRSAGATAILDRRSVFLSLSAIDISDDVIEQMDATVGDGAETGDGDP